MYVQITLTLFFAGKAKPQQGGSKTKAPQPLMRLAGGKAGIKY